MTSNNPYIIIALFCCLIILSYVFTLISKYIKIPSIILLIATGVIIQFGSRFLGFDLPDLQKPLKFLGVIGLLMIVLEGALDLKLNKSKIKTILSACISALFILGLTNLLIGEVIFLYEGNIDYKTAFFYAIPLSVVSSAIVIPSVHTLIPAKKEFMVLESTLSDIIGIMLFEFWILDISPGDTYVKAIGSNIFFSLITSLIISYLLVYIFHKIKTQLKFFLLLSILALLYSIGEYFHYSALLIVLIFGIVLNNPYVFFKWKLRSVLDDKDLKNIKREFIIITLESSFLIRTFFFVVFGFTLNLEGLFDVQAVIVSLIIMALIFIVRAINLKVFIGGNAFPEMLIAPRGLVTILLFQKVLEHSGIMPFSESVLALTIIGTNLIMMIGLILSGSDTQHTNRLNITHPEVKTSTINNITQKVNDKSNEIQSDK